MNLKELNAIEKELQPEELQRISVGPTYHDFGACFILSRNQFSFSCQNANSNPIHLEIMHE